MTREEAKSCIGTIEMLQRLAYNIHGVMDVIDADNCENIIKALEQEPVLDKIRAEIEQAADKQFQIAMGVSDLNERYAHIRMENAYRHSLNIIDKYKAESEGE